MKKRLGYFLLSIFAFASSVAAQNSGSTSLAKANSAEKEIRTVIVKWADAVKRRDIAVLDRMFANDLFITDYGGATRGKKEELEFLKPSDTTRTVSVINENVAVRTYPRSNTAIVTAIVRMIFRTNGRDSSLAMRYTSVWEKRSGRWQLTVLQTTRLAPR